MTLGEGESAFESTDNVAASLLARPRPQETFHHTHVEPTSFFGRLRKLYSNQVLKTQLEQLKKQGSYVAFKGDWHPAYDVRRVHDGRAKSEGSPPSLFWESDVAKWIEAVCYYLSSPDAEECQHASAFSTAVEELVDMIEQAQQPDGYLNVYFTVVDPGGKLKNLRDFHEMYNAGHLIEAALAHHRYTGSTRFVDVMMRNVAFFMKHIGPRPGQLHGYPGHPEIELALLRLYSVSRDLRHIEFAKYLLEERGKKREDQGGECWFLWEPKQRQDEATPPHLTSLYDLAYNQANCTLLEATQIVGHSVRALYLAAGAADAGGELTRAAERLWLDAVDNKMYQTGGVGSEPFSEGFSLLPHYLPQSTGDGGCYVETCASIALVMVSERLLSHRLSGKVRDVMELCLYNVVLGGGSLDGKAFSYANKHATWGDEVATRSEWFEVCCCPPNLSRTLGMLGGYTWSVHLDPSTKIIGVSIYLFLSASRTIELPSGEFASIQMSSEMPWVGRTQLSCDCPADWTWNIWLPKPAYASNFSVSVPSQTSDGIRRVELEARSTLSYTFDMPVRLLAPHADSGQDTLTVTRGPIVYTAESFDNPSIDSKYPHFSGVGILSSARWSESIEMIQDVEMIMLQADRSFVWKEATHEGGYRVVSPDGPGRTWKELDSGLKLVPWFARANRGGAGRVRTAFLRAQL